MELGGVVSAWGTELFGGCAAFAFADLPGFRVSRCLNVRGSGFQDVLSEVQDVCMLGSKGLSGGGGGGMWGHNHAVNGCINSLSLYRYSLPQSAC